MEYQVCDWCE